MSTDSGTNLPGHPSPHAHRLGYADIIFALFGGVAAWVLQLMVNYGVASHACFPRAGGTRLAGINWAALVSPLVLVNLAALLLGGAAVFVAWRNWRATRNEHHGGRHHLLETGEGRSRFLSASGIMMGLFFLLVILANALSLLTVPPCAG